MQNDMYKFPSARIGIVIPAGLVISIALLLAGDYITKAGFESELIEQFFAWLQSRNQ